MSRSIFNKSDKRIRSLFYHQDSEVPQTEISDSFSCYGGGNGDGDSSRLNSTVDVDSVLFTDRIVSDTHDINTRLLDIHKSMLDTDIFPDVSARSSHRVDSHQSGGRRSSKQSSESNDFLPESSPMPKPVTPTETDTEQVVSSSSHRRVSSSSKSDRAINSMTRTASTVAIPMDMSCTERSTSVSNRYSSVESPDTVTASTISERRYSSSSSDRRSKRDRSYLEDRLIEKQLGGQMNKKSK